MRDRSGTSDAMYGARAAALFAVTAAAIALGFGLVRRSILSTAYYWRNDTPDTERLAVLKAVVVAVFASLLLSVGTFLQNPARSGRLWRLARAASPLGPLALCPWLLSFSIWQGHDLAFLCAALLVALSFGAAVSAALGTGLLAPEFFYPEPLGGRAHTARHFETVWFWTVVAAALAYIVWFSYYTSVWHLSVRSGYDTSIEDNILWNISHGGPFFKATPTLGPVGSHFRRHATLISYLFAPVYWVHPGATTLLVLQSVLQGAAAVPLFLFARRHVGERVGAIVAILYLLQPALQQSNLFEVHYVKFGVVFLWTTLWLLDSGRNRLALVAALLTLFVREDVATWVIVLGVWALMTGRSLRTSLAITVLSVLYVAVVKFGIMPALAHGEDELTFMYAELLPTGKSGFGWVMATVLGNPAFTLESLFDIRKLIFFLQALVPLALVPLHKPIGWFALIPWCVFCLISTHYPPLVDIHFQYSAHLLAFLFPALVLVLEAQAPNLAWPHDTMTIDALSARIEHVPSLAVFARREGTLASMIVGTLLCSYQYGAVLQQNTSRGGPIPYKFGWDDEGRARRVAVDSLLQVVPARARIAASAFTVPQVSARPNAYSLSLSLYDAEWLIAPSHASEFVGDELERTTAALRSGQWGVVKIADPFFVARIGAPTALNGQLLSLLRRR